MARLEPAIQTMVELFEEYADSDGKLSKDELKKLFENEIENPEIKERMSDPRFDKVMRRMDRNRDGDIDFREFFLCLGFLTRGHYRKKTGRGCEDED